MTGTLFITGIAVTIVTMIDMMTDTGTININNKKIQQTAIINHL